MQLYTETTVWLAPYRRSKNSTGCPDAILCGFKLREMFRHHWSGHGRSLTWEMPTSLHLVCFFAHERGLTITHTRYLPRSRRGREFVGWPEIFAVQDWPGAIRSQFCYDIETIGEREEKHNVHCKLARSYITRRKKISSIDERQLRNYTHHCSLLEFRASLLLATLPVLFYIIALSTRASCQ